MGLDRRGCVVQPRPRANRRREELVDKAKPFDIAKREIWEAFKRVKANQGRTTSTSWADRVCPKRPVSARLAHSLA
jgi:hypothetical protein